LPGSGRSWRAECSGPDRSPAGRSSGGAPQNQRPTIPPDPGTSNIEYIRMQPKSIGNPVGLWSPNYSLYPNIMSPYIYGPSKFLYSTGKTSKACDAVGVF